MCAPRAGLSFPDPAPIECAQMAQKGNRWPKQAPAKHGHEPTSPVKPIRKSVTQVFVRELIPTWPRPNNAHTSSATSGAARACSEKT